MRPFAPAPSPDTGLPPAADAVRPPVGGALAPVRLEVDALVVERGGRRVLDALSLTLEPGATVVLRGDNGAGKSTLLRAILGLVPRRAGTVRLSGPTIDDPDDVGRHCHYLGHGDAVKPTLTLREALGFWHDFLAPADGRGDRAGAVTAALEATGLADLADLPGGYLSAGQRRRLAIARLLVAPRPIWLLDEPTAALDAGSEATLIALIGDHRARGGSVLAATHLPLAFADARRMRLSPARDIAP